MEMAETQGKRRLLHFVYFKRQVLKPESYRTWEIKVIGFDPRKKGISPNYLEQRSFTGIKGVP